MKDMRAKILVLKKQPKRKLSTADIKREGYMPWATHHRTILGILKADKIGPNILNVAIENEEKQTRYTVTSANLIKYLTAYGPALISMIRRYKK